MKLLWARRIAVGVGAVAAIAAGALAIGRVSHASPTSSSVTAEVLVDTSESQLVAADPAAADTLALRAYLLADLIADRQFKTLIAARVGVPASQLDVIGASSSALPQVENPFSLKAATFGTVARGPYALTLAADQQTPVITIGADAPDGTRAAKLADAAIGALQTALGPGDGSNARGFRVHTVQAPQAVAATGKSSHRIVAVIGVLAIIGLWCAGIVVVSGFSGRMRPRAA